jgi:hypothetical protein
MGRKRIDETMIYVHVAENHRRKIPGGHRGSGCRGTRSGPADPQDARRAWQPRGSELGVLEKRS